MRAVEVLRFNSENMKGNDLHSYSENDVLANAIDTVLEALIDRETHASELLAALEDIFSQATAQFKCGDRHATFNRQTIDALGAAIANAERK